MTYVLAKIDTRHKILYAQKMNTRTKIWTRAQKYGHAHKNMDTRTKIWTRTQKCGHARKNIDTHAKILAHKKYGHAKIQGTQKLEVQKF